MLLAINYANPARRVLRSSTVKMFFSQYQHSGNEHREVSAHNQHKKLISASALQGFLDKTYTFSGASVVGTLGIATVLSHSAMVAQSPGTMLLGGFGLSIAGIFGVSFGKYTTNALRGTTTNSATRLAGLAALVSGMGISSAPAFAFYDLSYVLPPSLLMTTMVFTGASVYARKAQPGSFLAYGPALSGGLLGLVGTGLVGIGSEMFFGPNMFSALAHNVQLYAGIPLFTAFVAYDTHVAIQRFESGDPDHLGCSLELYLDFMNILVRMMKIVNKIKRE